MRGTSGVLSIPLCEARQARHPVVRTSAHVAVFFSLALTIVFPLLPDLASTRDCGEAVAGYLRQSSLPTVVLNDPCFFFNPAHRVPTGQYKCSCRTFVSKSFHTGKLRALIWNFHSPLPTAVGSLLMTCAARGATRYKVAKVSTHVCYFSIPKRSRSSRSVNHTRMFSRNAK